MAMNRADISRAMFVGQKDWFVKTLKKNKREEWKTYMRVEKSTKSQETYDTLGNLHPAQTKTEEGSVKYGKLQQAFQTTIVNETKANGLTTTMEVQEDDQYNLVDKAGVSEVARTLLQLRERESAATVDGLFTTVGADGVAYIAANHPLLNSALVNNNLAAGPVTPANLIAANNMFNGWLNHAGEAFDTMATAILAHKNLQSTIVQVMDSTLVAFESSNTKNAVPQLKQIYTRYIAALPWFLIDEELNPLIFQRRKGLVTEYDYDKRDTFNHYFNAHERYRTGCITPGFGIVGSPGV